MSGQTYDPSEARPLGKRSVKWGQILVCLFAAGLAIAMIEYDKGRPRRIHDTPTRVKCGSNLRQIGQACMLYANENKDHFPDTFEQALLTQDLTSNVFVCPQTGDSPAAGATTQETVDNLSAGGHLSYVYVGKGFVMGTVRATAIVAYEPLANHQNTGMNVLFGDLHVEFLDLTQGKRMLEELEAGHNPPRAEAGK